MPLKDYTELSQSELLVEQFQENTLKGLRFRITVGGNETAEGVPTAVPGKPTNFTLRMLGGKTLSIPFADVAKAESLELDDSQLMRLAISESKNCVPEKGKSKPVPKVGAVLAMNGRFLASAYRNEFVHGDKGDEGDHAEKTLLVKKLKDEEAAVGATLYTTLEPCCTGRSHSERPCTEHIIQHGIRRVVIGTLDPNQDICGKGVLRLRDAGIDVSLCGPDLMKQIEVINREFIWEHRGRKAAEATGVMAVPPSVVPAATNPAPPANAAPTAIPPSAAPNVNSSTLPNYVRAEFDFPVVYRRSATLAVQVRLWTVQQLPQPLVIHAWRLIHVRIDGQEVKPSDRFNERVLTMSASGRIDFQQEVEFQLSAAMAKREQITISGQLQLEIVGFAPPPVVLSVEERYCRMCP